MPDFPKLPIVTPPGNTFPELPILTPDPPRTSLREKYGNLYYLAIAGLAVTLSVLGRFAYGLWATRDVWTAVYVLHEPTRPDLERIQAAWVLARSPSANDRQRVDIALRKEVPPLARYLVAEGLTSEAIRADPKGYALMVAKSEGWPDWLRLLMARPMAYGAGEGYRIAWEPLDLLRENPDPAIALWATYTRAVMAPGDPSAARALAEAASKEGTFRPLATLLDGAARAEGAARVRKLDEATAWLRTHHPEAKTLWGGWEERGGKLVETSGRKKGHGHHARP
jgi:hypothetical protein